MSESERYYLAYQRGAVVCLLSAIAAGGYFLAVVFGGLSGRLVSDGAMVIIALFVTSLLAVSFATLRGASGAGAIRKRSSSCATSGLAGTGTAHVGWVSPW